MSCNCASQEQIKKLHELYGEKVNPSTPTTLNFKINKILTNIGVYIAMILIVPVLMGYISYKFFKKDNKISLKKIVGFLGYKNTDVAIAKNIIENTNITK